MSNFKGSEATKRGVRMHIQAQKDIMAGTKTYVTDFVRGISSVRGEFERACYVANNSHAKRIDYMIMDGNTIHIIDFKSGDVYAKQMSDQFAMYNFAIAREYPNMDIMNHAIYMDSPKGSYSIHVNTSNIERDYKATAKTVTSNHPSTISVSGRYMGEVIGVATSSVTYLIRETNSRDHRAVFANTEVPAKVGTKTNSTYAFTRDIIFDMIMYYGVTREVTNPVAQQSVIEIAKYGIDAFIESHF